MGNTRTVSHAIGNGYITVSARARSIPEALALDAALQNAPPAESFEPVLTPEPTVPSESDLPPAALADADDNVGDLKAGEAVA